MHAGLAAFPGCQALEVFPHEAFPPGERCDAFVPGCPDAGRLDLAPEDVLADSVTDGALVCLLPFETPPPATRPKQDHLHSLPHVSSLEQESMPLEENMLAVFLGFGFDQFCLRLPFGSVPRFVANALDIPFDSVFLCRQLDPFDCLTVAGRRRRLTFGFRNLADMGRPFTGRGLFIDARPLGRPVCFREILVEDFTPRQLCQWLEVTVPEGYEPFCGTPKERGNGSVTNFHGESVVVWVDETAPAPPLSATTEPSGGTTAIATLTRRMTLALLIAGSAAPCLPALVTLVTGRAALDKPPRLALMLLHLVPTAATALPCH